MSEDTNTTPETTPAPEVALDYTVVTVAELFNPRFMASLAKLKLIAYPRHQRVKFKRMIELFQAEEPDLMKERMEIIQGHGGTVEGGKWSVDLAKMTDEKKDALNKEWAEFHASTVKTGLDERFIMPESENVLTPEDDEMIGRFLNYKA